MNGSDARDSEHRLALALRLLATACDLVQEEVRDAEDGAADGQRLAMEYERTAALYRRRAALRPEDAQDLTTRAEWFERRAQAKRSGAPMPRELRTPAETLATVDGFRRALTEALAIAGEVETRDFAAFARCLVVDDRPREVEEGELQAFVGCATRLLAALGVFGRLDNTFELAGYRVPLAEGE